ncbi:hypothetical protein [Bifidobacterium simiarum]|uniref:hypothetical protein n=1 Tax=Bifidobacterium simiarum TaxID=2045441 RepID=UPI001056D899|nr:hypothetical protein [Bifidobacterium simiarum]
MDCNANPPKCSVIHRKSPFSDGLRRKTTIMQRNPSQTSHSRPKNRMIAMILNAARHNRDGLRRIFAEIARNPSKTAGFSWITPQIRRNAAQSIGTPNDPDPPGPDPVEQTDPIRPATIRLGTD